MFRKKIHTLDELDRFWHEAYIAGASWWRHRRAALIMHNLNEAQQNQLDLKHKNEWRRAVEKAMEDHSPDNLIHRMFCESCRLSYLETATTGVTVISADGTSRELTPEEVAAEAEKPTRYHVYKPYRWAPRWLPWQAAIFWPGTLVGYLMGRKPKAYDPETETMVEVSYAMGLRGWMTLPEIEQARRARSGS